MRRPVLAAGLLVMANVSATHAAPMTLAYTFIASGFQASGAGAAPVDPVIGSFDLTFDPTKPAQVTNVGLSVSGLNIVYDGIAEYGYSGVFNEIAIGDDVSFSRGHTVGGTVDPLANNFALYLALVPTVNAGFFTYSQAVGAVYVSEDVVLTPTAVPEPVSLALFGFSVLSMGMVRAGVASIGRTDGGGADA